VLLTQIAAYSLWRLPYVQFRHAPSTHRYGSDDGSAPLHIDAAASAAMLAIDKDARGVFNIAEPGAYASCEGASRA